MQSLKGQLLIASRHLSDPNFAQTVVLMLDHSKDGAVGLVLNRKTSKSVKEVWELLEGSACQHDGPLFVGGPVQGPLMCLHGESGFSDAQIVTGVFLSTQKDHLSRLVTESSTRARVFAGYSGWGEGQLENEIKVGGWLTVPATEEMIFDIEIDELWPHSLRLAGREFYRQHLGLRHFPDDVSTN